ncbi:MAG: hypothetical protein JF588_15990 [Caulobacterales bacterium]|nr:hypothetical protein [Caulobacterales bacterium]
MAPADLDVEFHLSLGRKIAVGWNGNRPQSAEDIAGRLKAMVEWLTAMRVLKTSVWPLFDRVPRASDPTVALLPTADLAQLIDRKARFDPPPLPRPVGPTGYHFVVASNELPREPTRASIWLKVGMSRPSDENTVLLNLHGRHPLWADEAGCREALRFLIALWGAEWGLIGSALRSEFSGGDRPPPSYALGDFVWMNWARPGVRRQWKAGFWTPPAPADAVEPWLNGQLSVWSDGAVSNVPGAGDVQRQPPRSDG